MAASGCTQPQASFRRTIRGATFRHGYSTDSQAPFERNMSRHDGHARDACNGPQAEAGSQTAASAKMQERDTPGRLAAATERHQPRRPAQPRLPSATAMQHSGSADLTAALHR